MLRTGLVIAAAAALSAANAQGSCDTEHLCEFTYNKDGESYNFDFFPLCGEDYSIEDDTGHTYRARICGTSDYHCNPLGWDNSVEYGVAVQYWGGVPPATSTCHGEPGTCSQDCQILGVGSPRYALIDPNNPNSGGVRVSFQSTRSDPDDPFYCPWDPSTMEEDPRVVHYYLECDTNYDSDRAYLYKATTNSTNDCSYSLHFRTAYACANFGDSLSGGWIFLIILTVSLSVYALVFGYLQYKKTGVIAWPHQEGWVRFFALVRDGAVFVLCCGKKPNSFQRGVSQFSGVGPKEGTPFTGATGGYQTGAGASSSASTPAAPASGKAQSAYGEL